MAGKKVSKEAGIGEGLSVRSRTQTPLPLCTPSTQFRQVGGVFRVDFLRINTVEKQNFIFTSVHFYPYKTSVIVPPPMTWSPS